MNNELKTINVIVLKTIIVPELFHILPKVIQDIVFEFNIEHRDQMKTVLNQLISYIFCINCNQLISPSILNRINCCSSECLYNLMNDT